MDSRSKWQAEINQIESIAETKGIDLDDIQVREDTTDDGDQLVVFRILETQAETEEDSVGVQVSKLPSVQTGDMTFRNDVQKKLSSLKNYLSESSEMVAAEQDDDEATVAETSDEDPRDTKQTDRSQTHTRSTDGSGPGAEIDARMDEIESDLRDLELRVEAIEEKAEVLENFQQMLGETDD